MREDVPAQRFRCDGCGSVTLIVAGEEGLPYGYHGTHAHITAWGGSGGTWFACKHRCLLKAIDNSERDDPDRDDLGT